MKASAQTLLLSALIADREPQLTVGGHPTGRLRLFALFNANMNGHTEVSMARLESKKE